MQEPLQSRILPCKTEQSISAKWLYIIDVD